MHIVGDICSCRHCMGVKKHVLGRSLHLQHDCRRLGTRRRPARQQRPHAPLHDGGRGRPPLVLRAPALLNDCCGPPAV